MTNTEKIMDLIKGDKEIAEALFLFFEFPEDISIWTGDDEYPCIDWLFVTQQEQLSLIGIDQKNKAVYCIDDEGEFHKACNSLQDIPYEIIRIESSYSKNKLVLNYVNKYPNFLSILSKYEAWCKENGIELDKNNIYHDTEGKLFTHYFEKE